MMETEELRQSLERLHAELHSTRAVNEQSKEVLRELMTDIREILADPGPQPSPRHETLVKHLEDSVEHFEVSHPGLTALINNVIATLNNLGI